MSAMARKVPMTSPRGTPGDASRASSSGVSSGRATAPGSDPPIVRRGLDARLAQQLQGAGVDTAVLPDLEAQGVEAEGLDLPAELLQVTVRDPPQALRNEGIPELIEHRDVGVWRRESACERRPGDQVAPGAPKTLLDERQSLSVWLLGESAPDIGGGIGQIPFVASQLGPERRPEPAGRCRGGDGLRQPLDDRLVPSQDVVRLDAQGLTGDVRGDVGVAVPVATDPGPPLHERAHARWPGPGHARVGRRGERAGIPVQRAIEGSIQTWRDHEQRFVEERHGAAHLVEGRRRKHPQRRGMPQEADGLAQPPPDLGILGRRQSRIVERVEQPVAAPKCDEQRPATRFGGMGGEHQTDRQLLQRCASAAERHALTSEHLDRFRHRPVEQPVLGLPGT